MLRMRRQRGYVLLATLVLVMLVSLASIGASRSALRAARVSADAELSLQRRWGALSIQRSVLSAAESMLRAEEQRQHAPQRSLKRSATLCGIRFDLTIADEQAKANVNTLLAGRDRADGERRLREALAGIVPSARILLRERPSRVSSFGQFLDGVTPDGLLSGRAGLDAPASVVTGWGDGRLNVSRASEKSIRAALTPLIGGAGAGQVAQMRSRWPREPLSQVFARLNLTDQQRHLAETAITESSKCHSVWIVSKRTGDAQSPTPAEYRLCVETLDRNGKPCQVALEW